VIVGSRHIEGAPVVGQAQEYGITFVADVID
jgi:hypothetical protein